MFDESRFFWILIDIDWGIANKNKKKNSKLFGLTAFD